MKKELRTRLGPSEGEKSAFIAGMQTALTAVLKSRELIAKSRASKDLSRAMADSARILIEESAALLDGHVADGRGSAGDTQLLTAHEAANLLRVHLITIYRHRKAGKLRGRKVGRLWRFDREELSKIGRHSKSS